MIVFLKLFYGILKEFVLIVKVVMFVNNVQADEIRLTIITFITYDTNNDNIWNLTIFKKYPLTL